jgi:hypothetical protein
MTLQKRSALRAVARPRTFRRVLLCCVLLGGCVRDWDAAEPAPGDRDASAATATEPEDTFSPDAALDQGVDASESDANVPEPDAFAPLDLPGEPEPDAAATSELDARVADTGTAGDASAAPRFCANQSAAFCADFEDGTLDAFDWQELTETSPVSLSVVEEGAAPGRRALKSTLSGAGDEAARVALWLADGVPAWVHASFDFLPQFNLPPQGGSVFWFKLSEQTGTRFPGVGFSSDQEGNKLLIHGFDGVAESYDAYAMEPLPAGWVRVDVMITFGANGNVTVRFNGQLAAVFTGPLQVVGVTQSYLQLGVYAQQALAPSALYDNVVVEHPR